MMWRNSYKNKFIDAMDDDLNTADALGAVFELVKDVNMNVLGKSNAGGKTLSDILDLFCELTGVLGILYEEKSTEKISTEEIEKLIEKRNNARKEKNWKLADEIRDELKSKNVIIEDTSNGTKYTFK